jgi:hypothetical protein
MDSTRRQQAEGCIKTHGDKDWAAIAALVPGRTKSQCSKRWRNGLYPCIRKGKWAEDEDIKLKDAVQTHGDKDWVVIATLVPGRTTAQCCDRWHNALKPSIDRASGRTGKWTALEDSKLKDALKTHGDKDWAAIAALVPGRTKNQCYNRWYNALDPSIGRANGRTGKWAEGEDSKLKDAVQTHRGKDWVAISALVPCRTKNQCRMRWHDGLKPNITGLSGRMGKWAEDELTKLKDAVQRHGIKDWNAISALVPGRTRLQCRDRWRKCMEIVAQSRENNMAF